MLKITIVVIVRWVEHPLLHLKSMQTTSLDRRMDVRVYKCYIGKVSNSSHELQIHHHQQMAINHNVEHAKTNTLLICTLSTY